MKNENVKNYLERIQHCNVCIQQREAELVDLGKDIAYIESCHCPSISTLETLSRIEREIEKKIEELTNEREFIIDQIQSMKDERYRNFLYKRYVERKTFLKMSFEMAYNEDYIRYLHGGALAAFGELYHIEG